ncbi:ComEC/Rec2 family competence protein [Aminobacterium mobile]|uniref:ComEC/Rec2 family competence protein n=1 Tax=Aminobacterium mobile TaxID=81467 RepID=UPI00046575F5|nr:ComEC/Rec2 family competence protein [Aminobacterium mobile]
MTVLGRAPVLCPFAGVCVALIAQDLGVSLPLLPLLSVLSAGALILCWTVDRSPGYWAFFGGIMAITALASLVICRRVPISTTFLPQEYGKWKGYIVSERSWGGRRAALVKTPKGIFLAKVSPRKELVAGQKVEMEGRILSLPHSDKGSFREDLYWRARGAVGEIMPARLTVVGRCSWFHVARWRNLISKRILLTLPPRTRAYLLAAWTGMKDPELKSFHERWGTSHLLAVSGFHVAIFAGGISLLLRRSKGHVWGTSLFLWLYVFLTGAAASAVRAALMMQIALLGHVRGRPVRPLNSVSLAGLLLLLWRPWWFWDLGWRLSVLAAYIIAAALERNLTRGWLLSVGPLIWGTTLPLVATIFGSVPLAGLLINPIAGPVFGFLYPFASLMALPALAGIPGGRWVAYGAEGLFILWEYVADFLATLVPWRATWNPLWDILAFGMLPMITGRALSLSWKRTMSVALSWQLFSILLWR